MGKLSGSKNNLLPDFQKFLLERKLAPEKNIPFLAYWVSRFLGFCRRLERVATEYNEITVQEFIEELRADNRTLDWQPQQAEDAIILYYFNYLGKTGGQTGGIVGISDAENALREGTNLLIAELLYGAGLRLMELARLRVQDIDFDSNTVFVRSGKGDKDRSTILPSAVKERLADHLNKIKLDALYGKQQ